MTIRTRVRVGAIGPSSHGKTTLTAALASYCALRFGGEPVSLGELARPASCRRGVTPPTAVIKYDTGMRGYLHTDGPGLAGPMGEGTSDTVRLDGAILLIDGASGLQPQTVEHVMGARQAGVASLIVFVNKTDRCPDPQDQRRVEMQAAELLYEGGHRLFTLVRGSALSALHAVQANRFADPALAAMADLVEALDRFIPGPRS
jgi:elongation factor Tu